MNNETEDKVAQALDTVIAPYRKALLTLTPGESILFVCDLGEVCRMVSLAVERAKIPQSKYRDQA